eukprot:RCo008406
MTSGGSFQPQPGGGAGSSSSSSSNSNHVPVQPKIPTPDEVVAMEHSSPAAKRPRCDSPSELQVFPDENEGDTTKPWVLNLLRKSTDPLLYFPRSTAALLKRHQVEGIRFLWDNVVTQPDPALRGCVLAHSMGLGKTLQALLFVYLFLRYQVGSRVLIVAPKNTLRNWANEVDSWCARCQLGKLRIFVMDDVCKREEDRREMVSRWAQMGGIFLVGYEMLTLLLRLGSAKGAPEEAPEGEAPPPPPEPAEGRSEDILDSALRSPGPDLLICDEGHRIKSQKTAFVRALKSVQTTRRVILTGTPLQNHLSEYWTMIDFVRGGMWSRNEFRDLFETPIRAGQHSHSSAEEIQLMKKRAYALSSELSTFVHRRDQALLREALPPMHEVVVVTRLTPLQRKLVDAFQHFFRERSRLRSGAGEMLAFTSMQNKICTHPDLVRRCVLAATSAAEQQEQLPDPQEELLQETDPVADVEAGADTLNGGESEGDAEREDG